MLTAISNIAKASDYSNIRSVDHNAEQIKTAAGDIPQIIYCKFWGTNIVFAGDIRLETKDNKYRLSFNEMRNVESGVLLADLPQTQKSCSKAMIKFDEKLYNKINNWKDF